MSTSTIRSGAAVTVACVALFTDMLVYGLAIPVLPLLPATVSAGPAATGFLFAGYAVAMIAVTPLAGRLVDRSGPRGPLLLGLVGLAAATVLFALGGPFWLLVVARALQGVAAGMSWVAGLALIAAVTSPRSRGRSMGLAMSMVSIGVLVGPPLSGLLVDAMGTRAPFIAAAALALADGVLRILVVRSLPPSEEAVAGPVAVLRVPGTAGVLTAVVLGAGTIAAVEPVLPLHLTGQQGFGPLGIGLLFALIVVSGAVLNPLVGGLVGRVDARGLVGGGVVLAALGLVVLALSGQTWQFVVAAVIIGASNAMLLAPATTLIGYQGMRASPPAVGASYAAFNLAYATGLFVGPLLGGGMTGLVGFGGAVIAVAVVTAVSGGIGVARLPTGRG